MATSGSYDFNLDRDGIVKAAMDSFGALALGDDPTTDECTLYGRMLNIMLKGWQTEGIGLWLNQKITLFLAYETQSYLLGPTGSNASATVVKTEVKTAGVATDGTIVVDSITSVSDGDYIGIELDDGTAQWTTINGDPAAYTITLTTALTDDVAVGNNVYTYTTKTQRPLGIIEARRVDDSGIETPLFPLSRTDYMALSNKTNTGVVTQYYYDPQLTDGAFYTWPACDNVKDTIKLTIKKPIEDFDAGTDEGEFPSEWLDAIVSNLAIKIAGHLGFKIDKDMRDAAATSKYMASTFDVEKESMYLQPEV